MSPSKTDKFFQTIWRFNGAVILLVITIGVIAIVGSLAVGLYDAVTSSNKEVPAPNVAPVAEGKPELRLGRFERITGTSVIKASLGERGGSYNLKSEYGGQHNLLFVETQSGKSWWLLPHSNASINAEHALELKKNTESTSIATLYELSETHEKKTITSLLLANITGQQKLMLVSGEIELDEVVTLSTNEAKVIYHNNSGYHIITVNPTTLGKLQEIPVTFAYPPQK